MHGKAGAGAEGELGFEPHLLYVCSLLRSQFTSVFHISRNCFLPSPPLPFLGCTRSTIFPNQCPSWFPVLGMQSACAPMALQWHTTCQSALIWQESVQPPRLGSDANMSFYLRQVMEPIKSAGWEEQNAAFGFPFSHPTRANKWEQQWRNAALLRTGTCSPQWCVPCSESRPGSDSVHTRARACGNGVCFTEKNVQVYFLSYLFQGRETIPCQVNQLWKCSSFPFTKAGSLSAQN